MAKSKQRRIAICPNCGAEFAEGRLACPECGSDAMTGWKPQEEIDYQSVDIPDFYNEPDAKHGVIPKPVFVAVAAIVIVAFVLVFVLGR